MKEKRSGSQIMFGHLPEQTVDIKGGIWKVQKWKNPRLESAVDSGALREKLIGAAYTWHEAGLDSGFVADLLAHKPVHVHSLNKEEGVWCERFPELYLCRVCKRLHDEPYGRCQCGSEASRGQLPFVGYHDLCGKIKTPYVRKCEKHKQRAVRFPGTASAAELVFYCPVCKDVIHRGFNAACDCSEGGALKFTVHRSGTVFSPKGVVLINPPKRSTLQKVEEAGGGERALEWLLEGMPGKKVTDAKPTKDQNSLRRILEGRGLDSATIESMLQAMPKQEDVVASYASLTPSTQKMAEADAKQVALATYEARITVDGLLEQGASGQLSDIFKVKYPAAMRKAGLERVELVDKFPVLTGQFGFTRGSPKPGESKLRPYRKVNGEYVVYGELAETEALFLQLNPLQVYNWLANQNVNLNPADDRRSAFVSILNAIGNGAEELVTKLIHTYSHAFIRRATVFAGIDRDSIAELVLPYALGFFVYASPKGNFVLGGLQSLFEGELHNLLEVLVNDEHRCALDPGCSESGGACAVCIQLGEPSCSMFNTNLSRETLAGAEGYFQVRPSR